MNDKVEVEQNLGDAKISLSSTEGSVNQNEITSNEMGLSILAHILGYFTSIFGPLIIWIIKKNDSEFLIRECKEAINFQLSLLVYWGIIGLLSVIFIGMLLIPVIFILYFFPIFAIVQVSAGNQSKYPLCIRFIK